LIVSVKKWRINMAMDRLKFVKYLEEQCEIIEGMAQDIENGDTNTIGILHINLEPLLAFLYSDEFLVN
jgi:hypothetical protein